MKKFFKKAAIAAAIVSGVATAAAPKAQARIFPGRVELSCVDGYYDVVNYGWFGSIRSLESGTC